MAGLLIFRSPEEALRAGFQILSIYPDREGFLPARMRTAAGWALALVRP